MNRRQIARQMGILFGGLLFLYVASIGPAYAIALKRSPTIREGKINLEAVSEFYSPVVWVCTACPPVGKILHAYVRVCLKFVTVPPWYEEIMKADP